MKRTITALLAILVAIGMMVTFTGGVAAQEVDDTQFDQSTSTEEAGDTAEFTVELNDGGDSGTVTIEEGERLLPASFNMEPVE